MNDGLVHSGLCSQSGTRVSAGKPLSTIDASWVPNEAGTAVVGNIRLSG